MLRSFAKMALAVAVLTTGAFLGAASAEENAKIDKMSFSITVPYKSDINVTSSDGSKWDTVLPTTIPLWADIIVDTRGTGYVERAGIFLGACSGIACGKHPRLAVWQMMRRDWEFHDYFQVNTGTIPVSTDGIAFESLGDAILGRCNLAVPQIGGTTQTVSFDHEVTLSLSVNTRKAASLDYQIPPEGDPSGGGIPFDGGDANKRTTFNMRVNCLAFEMITAPPEPFSVDVLVKPKGEACPKETEVTARIKYDQPVTARLRFKVDGEPSKWFNVKAEKAGGPKPHSPSPPNVFIVEHVKTYHLDPGQHHFRVEVQGGKQSDVKTLRIECPPFKVTSLWLTYDVEDKDTCPKKVVEKVTGKATRPGKAPFEIKTQGGLVVHSGMADFKRKGLSYVTEFGRDKLVLNEFESDMMALIKDQPDANSGWVKLKVDCLEVLSGKLTLSSLGDTSCKGEALVAIHTDGAGELPYELECGPGKSWQRKVTAMANKIGVDKVRFDVTNNEQVTCVLRTRIGGVLKPLDGASKTFQCHKPIDTGADDLAPDTRPEEPPVLDTLTGDFSFVDNGGTRCPRQGKALINFKTSKPDNVHYSLDCTNGHFSGVAPTAPSPQGGFIAPALVSFDVDQTTHANCVLKTVAPGKPKVHTLKGHTFQCVTPTDTSGSDDLAPDTRPDPKNPDKPGPTVVDPPHNAGDHTAEEIVVTGSRIRCTGGTVNDGACVCERTHKPVKAGKDAWRCVQSTVDPKPEKPTVSEPKISCANGVVKNGGCTCARTHKPVKAGKDAWRCVKVVVDPKPDKDSANKLELKTAPKKTAAPKPGNADKAKGGKGKGKAAKKGNGSSAVR